MTEPREPWGLRLSSSCAIQGGSTTRHSARSRSSTGRFSGTTPGPQSDGSRRRSVRALAGAGVATDGKKSEVGMERHRGHPSASSAQANRALEGPLLAFERGRCDAEALVAGMNEAVHETGAGLQLESGDRLDGIDLHGSRARESV